MPGVVSALECLATLEVPVVYVTSHGKFIASLMPAPAKNVRLRVNQVQFFSDPHKALTLAKAVVKAKVNNQRTLLMRCLRSRALARHIGTRMREARFSG